MNDKIQNITELESKEVSGGYMGRDWSPKYTRIYEKLGIEHQQNALDYDEYFLEGTRIPKSFVYDVAKSYFSEKKSNKNNEKIVMFNYLKENLKNGNIPPELDDMWRTEILKYSKCKYD